MKDLYRHPNGVEKLIDPSDAQIISVATRKGYVLVPPPEKSAEEIEAERQEAIVTAANAQKDVIRTPDIQSQINLMMRAVKRVRKEGKGQASGQDTSLLDQLESLADTIEAIDAEEARLIADTDLTVADANWPTN
jgi:hypothetical protein